MLILIIRVRWIRKGGTAQGGGEGDVNVDGETGRGDVLGGWKREGNEE